MTFIEYWASRNRLSWTKFLCDVLIYLEVKHAIQSMYHKLFYVSVCSDQFGTAANFPITPKLPTHFKRYP